MSPVENVDKHFSFHATSGADDDLLEVRKMVMFPEGGVGGVVELQMVDTMASFVSLHELSEPSLSTS